MLDQKDLSEKAKKIKEIYNKAIKKLDILRRKQQDIIKNYIKELEGKKVNDIRKKLGL